MKTHVLFASLLLFLLPGIVHAQYPVEYSISRTEVAKAGVSFPLRTCFKITAPWYIYAPTGTNAAQGMMETNIVFQLPKGISRKGKMQLPKSKFKGGFEIYEGEKIVFSQEFTVGSEVLPGNYIVRAKINYQACNEKICLPPMSEEVEIRVVVSPRSTVDSQQKSAGSRESVVDSRESSVVSEDRVDSSSFRRLRTHDEDRKPVALKFTAMDGRKVDLEKMKGKLVLIDCWASWCRPCIAEFANLKRLYAKYKSQGLEVIGISMDETSARQRVKDLVSKNKLPWPQYFEGKGFAGNSFKMQYGIEALPAVFLLDREGNIIDKDARGEKLEALIKANL